jgi:2-hydroxychromene-2-carboxylate isomerase
VPVLDFGGTARAASFADRGHPTANHRKPMTKTIDYYMSPMSPWAYLGHERLAKIARNHGAQIAVKPVDFGRIFPLSGGLPLPKRAPQLTIEPKHFPYDATLASKLIIAAGQRGEAAAMRLAGAIMRGCWAEERNMADEAQLADCIRAEALDPAGLIAAAKSPETAAQYEALIEEAIRRDVFGAPTYVYRDELFWGQDRLDFLDRALAA